MQLRLNPSHALCSPSRNLVFATFGTGLGSQVLDLSDAPSHGIVSHGSTVPTIHRTLQSDCPPGFPSDFQALNMSASTTAAVSFGAPSKVTALTSNFSAAMWYRPYGPNTSYSTGLRNTTDEFNSGWLILLNTSTLGFYASYQWALRVGGAGGISDYRIILTDTALTTNQWSLVSFSWTNNAVETYTNGVLTGKSVYDYWDSPSSIVANPPAGNTLAIGAKDGTAQRGNSGPVMIWGSALSASDHALLYRDTWGMVNQPPKTRFMSLGVAIPPSPPTILNPSNITTTIGSFFSTTVSGTNTPTSYAASSLPSWLSLNTTNGMMSGTPPIGVAKKSNITVFAANANGSGSKELTINLNKTPSASGFTTKARASRPYSQGGKTVFTGGTIIYQSGQSKLAQNPDIGGRLDQFRYYGS